MFVHEYEKPLLEYSRYRLHKYLLAYIPPVLLIIGTVGNILSIVILTRQSLRKYSTYMYLAVLAGTDTLVLYLGLLRLWLGEITGKDIKNQSDLTCKSISVLAYTLSDYSGWLIIAVTIERYIAVCRPLKAPSGACHRQRAYKVVVLLFLGLFFMNSHMFWTVEIKFVEHLGEDIAQCAGGKKYKRLIGDIWPWVDTVVYSFLPFVIILSLNALIVLQVVKARRDRRSLQTPGSRFHSQRHYGHTNPADSGGKITVMLMSISLTFLLTTLPVTISNIVVKYVSTNNLSTMITFRLMRTIVLLLMYTNHCINFFLYCATGQKFRKQFVWLLTHGRSSCRTNSNQGKRRFSSYPAPTGAAHSDISHGQSNQTNGISRNTSRHLLPLSELMTLHSPTQEMQPTFVCTQPTATARASKLSSTQLPLLDSIDIER